MLLFYHQIFEDKKSLELFGVDETLSVRHLVLDSFFKNDAEHHCLVEN